MVTVLLFVVYVLMSVVIQPSRLPSPNKGYYDPSQLGNGIEGVCVCFQSKLVSELQKKVVDLQSQLSDVERSAEDHLRSLATHTEAAIDAAQQRLSSANERLQEHSKFLKVCVIIMIYSGTAETVFLMSQLMV